MQDKYEAGWAKVRRLIWYRATFSTSWTPTKSCQNYWLSAPMFLIKEVMRIIRTGIRNAGPSWLSPLFLLDRPIDKRFKDFCIWSQFASGQGIVEGVGLFCKVWAPQAHVFNLFPYGIFLWPCSSLNYPPGSQSWVSNCPIKLFLHILWQVQQCRSFKRAHYPHLLASPCFLTLSRPPDSAQVPHGW